MLGPKTVQQEGKKARRSAHEVRSSFLRLRGQFWARFWNEFLRLLCSKLLRRVIAKQAWICTYFVAVFPLKSAITGKMLPALETPKFHSDQPLSACLAGFTFKNWCKDDGAGRTHRQPKKKPQNSEHEARNGAKLLPKAASRATSVPRGSWRALGIDFGRISGPCWRPTRKKNAEKGNLKTT